MGVRGRPRETHIDDAAMQATLHLIVEHGYPALAMDRVAELAGVSKAALYRRWSNKLALATDTIQNFARTRTPLPDTHTLRGDLTAYLHSMVTSSQVHTETMQALGNALIADPELAGRCRHVLVEHFTEGFRTLIDRGIQRAELPAGTDAELYSDLVPALIRYRRENTGQRLDDAYLARIVDQFFPDIR